MFDISGIPTYYTLHTGSYFISVIRCYTLHTPLQPFQDSNMTDNAIHYLMFLVQHHLSHRRYQVRLGRSGHSILIRYFILG